MTRNIVSAALLAGTVGWLGSASLSARPEEHKHDEGINACARACAKCMLECESCAKHCAMMVGKGEKKHMRTLATCADCGDFCALAARVVARQGAMMRISCESCAAACDVCGKACEEFPDDAHMKRCATACRECAKACREMVKHLGHAHEPSRTSR